MHILIIEDDTDFALEMADFLRNSLYQVTILNEFSHIVEKLPSMGPDLILLDLGLPEQSGFQVCTDIRRVSEVPIIFVTGRSDSADEVTALLKGGDDYITKPFHPSLLLAHISAVLKRSGKSGGTSVLEHQGVELDLAKGCVRFQGISAELTKNELKVLSCLFQHKGTIVSRRSLTEYLWDNSVFLDDNSLSIHVNRIRSKLEGLGLSDFIRTKRGMGYFI